MPGQQRPPGDPAQIERGKTVYGINCRSCHGADLRGGDLGGPNLLRSQVALSDQKGELILPILQGSRKDAGMPNIGLSNADGLAVAAYVRSVVDTIGGQGKPPSVGKAPATVVVGDASAGKTYFASQCAACHSPTGDLKGIATRISDPKVLQNAWMAGGERRRRRTPAESAARTPSVSLTLASGEKVEGSLVRIDDFLVTVAAPDGAQRTFRREGATPQVEIRDPMKAHRDLWSVITDKEMHDVTAYLVTLK